MAPNEVFKCHGIPCFRAPEKVISMFYTPTLNESGLSLRLGIKQIWAFGEPAALLGGALPKFGCIALLRVVHIPAKSLEPKG